MVYSTLTLSFAITSVLLIWALSTYLERDPLCLVNVRLPFPFAAMLLGHTIERFPSRRLLSRQSYSELSVRLHFRLSGSFALVDVIVNWFKKLHSSRR